MKKTLLIALLLIPLIGFSQTSKPIDGFLGIKFGSSKAVVVAAIKAKGGVLFKTDNVNQTIDFIDVKLGHRPTTLFRVKFVNNKVYEADFVFDPGTEGQTIEYYNDLVSDINDIYGNGEIIKNFKEPYKDGDGYETTAISTGNADYETLWLAVNVPKNAIALSIMTNLHVELRYQDAILIQEAIAKQKANEKGDF